MDIKTIEYLKEQLLDTGIHVAPQFHAEFSRQVVVQKTATSTVEGRFTESTLAIQSFAQSIREAHDLNEKIKELVYDMLRDDEIASVRLENDYFFPYTTDKVYRYQAVFKIYHFA